MCELRLLAGENRFGLIFDDGADECALVREVVIQLQLLTAQAVFTSSRVVRATPRSNMRSAAAATMRRRVARPLPVSCCAPRTELLVMSCNSTQNGLDNPVLPS